jgi:uncharacterized protein
MGFTLFSRELRFVELFEAECARLSEAGELLCQVLGGEGDVPAACRRINELASEHEAIAHDVTRELSLTLIRPLDRDDVFALNLAFESAIKAIRAIATRVGFYRLSAPRHAARELADDVREIVGHIERLLDMLNRGERPDEQAEAIQRIGVEAEGFLLVGLGELYEAKPGSSEELLEVIMWSQVYDRLEDALERVKHIANVLTLILLKSV